MVNGTDSEVRCFSARSPRSQDSYPGSPSLSPRHGSSNSHLHSTGKCVLCLQMTKVASITCCFPCAILWNVHFHSFPSWGDGFLPCFFTLLQYWFCISYFPQLSAEQVYFRIKKLLKAVFSCSHLWLSVSLMECWEREGLESKACFLYLGVCKIISFQKELSWSCFANGAKGHGDALLKSFSLPHGLHLASSKHVRREQFCSIKTQLWSISSSEFGKLNFRFWSGKNKINEDTWDILPRYLLQFWRWSEPGKITCRALGNSLSCFTELWAAHSHLSVLWVGIPTAACDKLWTSKYLRKTQLLEYFQAVTHLSKPVSLVFLCCVVRSSGCVSLLDSQNDPISPCLHLQLQCKAAFICIYLYTWTSPSTVLCLTLFFQKSGNFIRAHFRDEAELLWTGYSVFVLKTHRTAHLNLCVAVVENRNTLPAINIIVGSADLFWYITITSGEQPCQVTSFSQGPVINIVKNVWRRQAHSEVFFYSLLILKPYKTCGNE